MNFDLKDKTALVPGSSRRIGLEIARSLLNEGARVILCSRKREGLEAAAVTLGNPDTLTLIPGMGIYGIAKAGIEMMTKVLAAELALFNVQVNAVAPAMVRTDFSKPFWNNKELCDHVTSSIPMGRIAEIQDVVKPVLFLASEGSSYITGQTLVVDGGATVI